jgi:hypothetical protein
MQASPTWLAAPVMIAILSCSRGISFILLQGGGPIG